MQDSQCDAAAANAQASAGVLRRRFLETRAWHVTMIAMLMFVLFVPDIIALSDASNAVDPAINAALLLCMATFLSEFAANIACRPGYTPLEVWRGVSAISISITCIKPAAVPR